MSEYQQNLRKDKRDLDAKAAEVGCEMVLPNEYQLFIDLDSQQDQYAMEAVLALLKDSGFEIVVDKVTRSRNGNKHAYLRSARSLSEIERIALQAILGSDRKREAFAYLRWIDGFEPISVFFEKKA